MIKTIRFYRDFGDLWFVDIPEYLQEGGQLAELQMVEGADVWLNHLTKAGDEITLQLGFDTEIKNPDGKLLNVDINSEDKGNYMVNPDIHYLWLCPVLEWLCGGYPDIIYYKIIKVVNNNIK